MTNTHWKLFEGVVAAIERSLIDVPGASVTPNAQVPLHGSAQTRQVDVVIDIPAGTRRLRVGVEVRDTACPLDVTKIEQLGAKLQKLELDRRCVVSRRGYSADAFVEATRWGLELRVLEQIQAPDWWLANDFTMVSRTVELLAWRLDYSAEDLERVRHTVASVPGDTALLVTPSEPPANFRAVVANAGRQFVDEAGPTGLPDGHLFVLSIPLALPEHSYVRVGSVSLPLPLAVLAQFRVHVVTERIPLASFRLDDRTNAFTGVWQAQSKQLSMVTQSLPDGGRTYSFSLAEAAPPPSVLSPVIPVLPEAPQVKEKRPKVTHRKGQRRPGA